MQTLFTGEKVPLICVPMTAVSKEELQRQLHTLIKLQPDVIEWRADFFPDVIETSEVIETIQYIKETTDIPLLFTVRSEREGGESIPLDDADIMALLQIVCESTNVDMIDYEVMNERNYVELIRYATRNNNIELLLSYHHFSETPSNNELLRIGAKMEFFGADVAKIAVMPNNRTDVNRL